jgi:hypothetical protein
MDICAVRNLDSCPRLPPALSPWNFGHSDSSSGCYLLHSQFPHPVFDLCELWSTILPNISFLDIYDDYYDMMMMIWSHGVGIFFKKKRYYTLDLVRWSPASGVARPKWSSLAMRTVSSSVVLMNLSIRTPHCTIPRTQLLKAHDQRLWACHSGPSAAQRSGCYCRRLNARSLTHTYG